MKLIKLFFLIFSMLLLLTASGCNEEDTNGDSGGQQESGDLMHRLSAARDGFSPALSQAGADLMTS